MGTNIVKQALPDIPNYSFLDENSWEIMYYDTNIDPLTTQPSKPGIIAVKNDYIYISGYWTSRDMSNELFKFLTWARIKIETYYSDINGGKIMTTSSTSTTTTTTSTSTTTTAPPGN